MDPGVLSGGCGVLRGGKYWRDKYIEKNSTEESIETIFQSTLAVTELTQVDNQHGGELSICHVEASMMN